MSLPIPGVPISPTPGGTIYTLALLEAVTKGLNSSLHICVLAETVEVGAHWHYPSGHGNEWFGTARIFIWLSPIQSVQPCERVVLGDFKVVQAELTKFWILRID